MKRLNLSINESIALDAEEITRLGPDPLGEDPDNLTLDDLAEADEERCGLEPVIDDPVAAPQPNSQPAPDTHLSVIATIRAAYAGSPSASGHQGVAPEILSLERMRLRLDRYPVPLGEPVPDHELITALASQVPEFVHPEQALWKASPVRPPSVTSAGFLEQVFNSGEAVRLCAEPDERGLAFIVGSDWNESVRPGPDEVFFCPNPVRASQYEDPDERRSKPFTPWNPSRVCYLPVNFPFTKDAALRLTMRLPLPIVSITSCGHHGIHVLVAIPATSAPGGQVHQKQLIHHLVALGATRAGLVPRGLSCLPQARRGGMLQQLLYLNPYPTRCPIFPRFDDD